jgi:hypothetical protein
MYHSNIENNNKDDIIVISEILKKKIVMNDEIFTKYKSSLNSNTIKLEIDSFIINFCKIYDNSNHIIIDYRFFKLLVKDEFYNFFINYIILTINKVLENYNTFYIHIFLKSLTLLDIEKYYSFISNISILLQKKFPDKLEKCCIYEAPFIFSQIIFILSKFIDKKTQQKITIV